MESAGESRDPNQLRDRIKERLVEISKSIASLEKEEAALMRDLQVTEHFLAVWRRTNNLSDPDTNQRAGGNPPSELPTAPIERRKNPPREVVVDAALRLIDDANRPLSRAELFDRLKNSGIEVVGKDPSMALSTMLWRSRNRVVRLRDFGYWPADREYPQANYHPGQDVLFGAAMQEPEGELEEPED